ncbi:MAG: hypothetical protein QM776_11100 [Rhodocyclaceae bacterium]
MLILLGLAGWLAWGEWRNVDRHNEASARDVVFILNHAGLDAAQRIEVLRSEQSARSFNGDHLDFYCLQLSDFAPSVAEQPHWNVPVNFEPSQQAALADAFQIGEGAECLSVPSLKAISDIRANVLYVELQRGLVTGFRVVFADPSSRRLLYVSYRS